MFPSASALSEGAMREGFAPRRTRAARFRKRLPLISLSFVRSLTRLGTRLEGLLVRRGGKKKEEEKREKRKKKTKREREKRGKRERRRRRRTSNASFINVARAGFVSDENRVRNA